MFIYMFSYIVSDRYIDLHVLFFIIVCLFCILFVFWCVLTAAYLAY